MGCQVTMLIHFREGYLSALKWPLDWGDGERLMSSPSSISTLCVYRFDVVARAPTTYTYWRCSVPRRRVVPLYACASLACFARVLILPCHLLAAMLH
jgi:hypothetical protein